MKHITPPAANAVLGLLLLAAGCSEITNTSSDEVLRPSTPSMELSDCPWCGEASDDQVQLMSAGMNRISNDGFCGILKYRLHQHMSAPREEWKIGVYEPGAGRPFWGAWQNGWRFEIGLSTNNFSGNQKGNEINTGRTLVHEVYHDARWYNGLNASNDPNPSGDDDIAEYWAMQCVSTQ